MSIVVNDEKKGVFFF